MAQGTPPLPVWHLSRPTIDPQAPRSIPKIATNVHATTARLAWLRYIRLSDNRLDRQNGPRHNQSLGEQNWARNDR